MFAIAPTDLDWFERIRTGPIGKTVNFWTPTPWEVKGFREGDRLYFMLKSPVRKIGGYGSFVRYLDASNRFGDLGITRLLPVRRERGSVSQPLTPRVKSVMAYI